MVSERTRQTSIETSRFGSPVNPSIPVASIAPPVISTIAPFSATTPLPSMAFSGIPITLTPFFATLTLIPLKLDRENYFYWRSLVLPSVRAFDLEDFLFGTRSCPAKFISLQSGEGSSILAAPLQIGSLASTMIPRRLNPEYLAWMRTDQALMSWLLSSIYETMMGHVIHCTSSSQIWITLQQLFTTTSKARVLQLCFQLQSTKKGDMSIQDYILRMRGIANSLNSTGLLLTDDEFLLYILGGLSSKYDPVVVNLTFRLESLSLQEAQYMLQSQEL